RRAIAGSCYDRPFRFGCCPRGVDQLAAGGENAIAMTRRPAGRRRFEPPGFDQPAFLEPHQDRVERARLELGGLCQLEAVAPFAACAGERFEDPKGLDRRFARPSHDATLYM